MQWQAYDYEISDDVESSTHPTEEVQVEALSGMLPIPTVPCEADGVTLEDEGNDSAQNISDAVCESHVYQPSENWVGKDA